MPKKDTHFVAKKNKLKNETSLEEIIYLAASDLNAHSGEAWRYLVSLAKDGSLEQHQTKGSITKLADELLRKLRGRNNAH